MLITFESEEDEHVYIDIKDGIYDHSKEIEDDEIHGYVLLNFDKKKSLLGVELLDPVETNLCLVAEKYNIPKLKEIPVGLFQQIYQSIKSKKIRKGALSKV